MNTDPKDPSDVRKLQIRCSGCKDAGKRTADF